MPPADAAQLLSAGVSWCQLVSAGVSWCQLLSAVVNCCQIMLGVSAAGSCCQLLSASVGCCQLLSAVVSFCRLLIYLGYLSTSCSREAISAVCDRRGVEVDTINVYLEQSRTPLPLLTSETSWLGGRHIRIRAKDDSKSPVRGSSRASVTAPPSRKASAVNNVRCVIVLSSSLHYS